MRPTTSIVIPAHNERGCSPLLCIEIDKVLSGGPDFEIILVDDGSTDETLEELVEQSERRAHVRCLRLPTRQGQSAALLAGIRAANGQRVVTMDGDLQYFAEDIPRLLDELTNCDVVVGVRAQRADSIVRRAAARIGNLIRRLFLGDPFVDICCGLAAYRREWLRDLPPFEGLHRFLPAIVALRGARVQQIEVSHRTRRAGKSKYGAILPGWRAFFDLFGVRWGIKRQIVPSAAQERRTPPPPSPGAHEFETTEMPRAAFPESEEEIQEPDAPQQTDLLEPIPDGSESLDR